MIKHSLKPTIRHIAETDVLFDFLGVHFSDMPEMSKTNLENHRPKLAQRDTEIQHEKRLSYII